MWHYDKKKWSKLWAVLFNYGSSTSQHHSFERPFPSLLPYLHRMYHEEPSWRLDLWHNNYERKLENMRKLDERNRVYNGLKHNERKTKVMIVDSLNNNNPDMAIVAVYEIVSGFEYLSSVVSNTKPPLQPWQNHNSCGLLSFQSLPKRQKCWPWK